MKTFVDNVCRQAVERHIVKKLLNVFQPSIVLELSDLEIERIAAEPTALKDERRELTELVDALTKSLTDLRN